MDAKKIALKHLQQIPGVGKAVAADLWSMGYRTVEDLKGEDAELMYIRHNDLKRQVQDICMLYTFRCAVYYAETYGQPQDPGKLKWWAWKEEKKTDSITKDAEIRARKG